MSRSSSRVVLSLHGILGTKVRVAMKKGEILLNAKGTGDDQRCKRNTDRNVRETMVGQETML